MKGKAGLNSLVTLSPNQKRKSLSWANIKYSPVLSAVTFFDIQITYVIALQEDLC